MAQGRLLALLFITHLLTSNSNPQASQIPHFLLHPLKSSQKQVLAVSQIVSPSSIHVGGVAPIAPSRLLSTSRTIY